MNPIKCVDHKIRQRGVFLFVICGLASLVWFLFRVVPKPSRISYPCQRVAAPVASSFVAWIIGIITSSLIFHKMKRYWTISRSAVSFLCMAGAFILLAFVFMDSPPRPLYANPAKTFADSVNRPIGIARGIYPGRVVFVYDSSAAKWNGVSGYWWEDGNTDPSSVSRMLSQSIQSLTSESTDADAWDALFKYFNDNHGKGNIGYQPNERIAVKLNLVNCRLRGHSSNYGNYIYTSPQLVFALLKQLVYQAGVPDSMVTFYDTNMEVPYTISQRCFEEFPNVHFVDFIGGDGCEKSRRDTGARIHWSEELILSADNGGGYPAFVPTCLTQADYLINIANMKGHGGAGITLCAKNHFGSFCADLNGRPSRYAPVGVGLHPYIVTTPLWGLPVRQKGSYNPLVDLMGHKHIGDKTLLYMIDALYAVISEESEVTVENKWQSPPFNNNWTSSLFVSQDGVALESVAFDFFISEPIIQGIIQQIGVDINNVDNYLHEAALADNAPSGTVYDPEGDGVLLTSIGVHEHWNNAIDRQYSRNLGTGDGIELVTVKNSGSFQKEKTGSIPSNHLILKNYPNPFNPSTNLAFTLPEANYTRLRILNMLGEEVVCLADEVIEAGNHILQWNGKDRSGNPVPTGTYFAYLEAGRRRYTLKILLMK